MLKPLKTIPVLSLVFVAFLYLKNAGLFLLVSNVDNCMHAQVIKAEAEIIARPVK